MPPKDGAKGKAPPTPPPPPPEPEPVAPSLREELDAFLLDACLALADLAKCMSRGLDAASSRFPPVPTSIQLASQKLESQAIAYSIEFLGKGLCLSERPPPEPTPEPLHATSSIPDDKAATQPVDCPVPEKEGPRELAIEYLVRRVKELSAEVARDPDALFAERRKAAAEAAAAGSDASGPADEAAAAELRRPDLEEEEFFTREVTASLAGYSRFLADVGAILQSGERVPGERRRLLRYLCMEPRAWLSVARRTGERERCVLHDRIAAAVAPPRAEAPDERTTAALDVGAILKATWHNNIAS